MWKLARTYKQVRIGHYKTFCKSTFQFTALRRSRRKMTNTSQHFHLIFEKVKFFSSRKMGKRGGKPNFHFTSGFSSEWIDNGKKQYVQTSHAHAQNSFYQLVVWPTNVNFFCFSSGITVCRFSPKAFRTESSVFVTCRDHWSLQVFTRR